MESQFDLALVGSGVSGTMLMVRVLERLIAQPPDQRYRILMLERAPQPFVGVPYGQRSGATSLIITPLNEFLPPDEVDAFCRWIAADTDAVLRPFVQRGGTRSEQWLPRARQAIAEGTLDRLHVPRYLFGEYISDLARTTIAKAAELGVAECTLRHLEVVDIKPFPLESSSAGGPFVLSTRRVAECEAEQFTARRAVLALGMPPTKRLLGDVEPGAALLVEDPYMDGVDATIDRIADHLTNHPTDGPQVTVIGANAGSLEMLYQLANAPRIAGRLGQVNVLSPQGRLPERYVAPEPGADDGNARAPYQPANLSQLLDAAAGGQTISAADILDATTRDVQQARTEGISISFTLSPISRSVLSLLSHLDRSELARFAAGPGIEIGRLQRRAGDEYCDAADDLDRTGLLTVIAGSFQQATPSTDADNPGLLVTYQDPNGAPCTLPSPQAVVVNCAGSAGLDRPSTSSLIESLLSSGLCEASDSGFGFAVDDCFQAAPDLYVHGPMLAGNVVGGSAIWHVEHVGRILSLSRDLAGRILDR